MIKKMVYTGIAVLLLGAILYYYVYSNISNTISTALPSNFSKSIKNFTLSNNALKVLEFKSANSTISAFYVTMNKTGDVYLFNGSGFSAWSKLISVNSSAAEYLNASESLEGKGTVAIFANATNATFPFAYIKPSYAENYTNMSLGILPGGNYYIAVSEHNPAIEGPMHVSSVIATNLSISVQASNLKGISAESVAAILLFIIGIILIIIGLLKADNKKYVASVSKEEVDKLYSGIKTKASGARRKNKEV